MTITKYALPPKRILLSGASGLVGASLAEFLSAAGHTVNKLVRRVPNNSIELQWDPELKKIDPSKLEGFDAVIHLSGESVAGGRWTAARKQKILESRTKTTQFLVDTLRALSNKPKVFLCASAVGYYGNRGDELLSEDSSAGTGFLADVAKAWESGANQAEAFGVRVVNLRFGIILSPHGGALSKMRIPFRLGLGGVIGSGSQFMSWIAIDDAIGGIYHALATDSVRGPINIVAPRAATNLEFTKTLGAVLHRPTLAPVPELAIKLLLGEMGKALTLESTRVAPKKLLSTGYQFSFPTLESALRYVLNRPAQEKLEGGDALRDASPPS